MWAAIVELRGWLLTVALVFASGFYAHAGIAGCDGQTMATWVQAVGSVLAIAIAIYVPWRQREDAIKAAEQDRRFRCRDVAADMEKILVGWNSYMVQYRVGFQNAMKAGNWDVCVNVFSNMAMGSALPDDFFKNRDQWHLFGKDGQAIYQFIHTRDHILLHLTASHTIRETMRLMDAQQQASMLESGFKKLDDQALFVQGMLGRYARMEHG